MTAHAGTGAVHFPLAAVVRCEEQEFPTQTETPDAYKLPSLAAPFLGLGRIYKPHAMPAHLNEYCSSPQLDLLCFPEKSEARICVPVTSTAPTPAQWCFSLLIVRKKEHPSVQLC